MPDEEAMLFVAATVSVAALAFPVLNVKYITAKKSKAITPHIAILRSIFIFPPYNFYFVKDVCGIFVPYYNYFSFYYKTLKISNPIIINIIITVNQDTFLFSGLSWFSECWPECPPQQSILFI